MIYYSPKNPPEESKLYHPIYQSSSSPRSNPKIPLTCVKVVLFVSFCTKGKCVFFMLNHSVHCLTFRTLIWVSSVWKLYLILFLLSEAILWMALMGTHSLLHHPRLLHINRRDRKNGFGLKLVHVCGTVCKLQQQKKFNNNE